MNPTRPKLAVILTQYGARSHGECYCTKFLEGKQFDDHFEEPRCDVEADEIDAWFEQEEEPGSWGAYRESLLEYYR